MRYLAVATTGYLLLIDLLRRETTPIEDGRPEYYGISWFPGGEDLVLSHSGTANDTLVDLGAYAQSEVGWVSHGDLASAPFLSQPHQILCLPPDRVVCTNTGRNAVTIIDLSRPGLFQETRVGPARWDRLSPDDPPGDHLNSVFQRDDRLYVVANRFDKGSQIATFRLPDLALDHIESVSPLTGLHNLWITDSGQKISCVSNNGSLVDIAARRALWESGCEVFTRGLAASDAFVIVGESQKTGRDLRRSSLSGLWILDRATWKAVDHLCLGPYGAVNEVRVLDVPDEAHHGHVFAGLEALLARDMRREVSHAHLARSARANAAWQGYQRLYGEPEPLAGGALAAGAEDLCLALRVVEDGRLGVTYALSQSGHVSAVIGYAGEGRDSDMASLLLQNAGTQAVLSLWRNRQLQWIQLAADPVDLPTAGHLELVAEEGQATMRIDDRFVITVTADQLGLDRCDRGLGVRWSGATVRLNGHQTAGRARSAPSRNPVSRASRAMPRPRSLGFSAVIKRSFDLAIALTSLIVLSPMLAAIALLIRLKIGRPILFRQTRPGLGGSPFVLIKFRTLSFDGEHLPNDLRLTGFARWLRSTSLDELPQLINVLKGEMSLVGPRPLLLEYLPLFPTEMVRRHTVRPGMTGWAQVNGRNALTLEQKMALDLWYVEHRWFGLDIAILARTLVTVLRRKGIEAGVEPSPSGVGCAAVPAGRRAAPDTGAGQKPQGADDAP